MLRVADPQVDRAPDDTERELNIETPDTPAPRVMLLELLPVVQLDLFSFDVS